MEKPHKGGKKGEPRTPGAGMPEHAPTVESRAKVEAYASIGVPVKMIATLIGLGSDNTLRKHYGPELERGAAMGLAQVANTLFSRATKGNDLGAAIFYLKARGGWSEKTVVEHQGKVTLEQLVTASIAGEADGKPASGG